MITVMKEDASNQIMAPHSTLCITEDGKQQGRWLRGKLKSLASSRRFRSSSWQTFRTVQNENFHKLLLIKQSLPCACLTTLSLWRTSHFCGSVCQKTVFPAPLRILKAGAHPRTRRWALTFHHLSSAQLLPFHSLNIEPDIIINPKRNSNSSHST